MAESWALKGDIAGACPCDSPCPCVFGRDADNGVCTAITCMSIATGNYGSTDLSGRKVGLAFHWTGNAFSGDITYGIYVDDGANDDQASALEQILTGKAGGAFGDLAALFGTIKGVKRVPIDFQGGKKPTFKIGSLANAEVSLLVGADQQGPLIVKNSPFDFGPDGLKIGTSTGRFVDKEWGFDTELNYGDSGTVDLSG
jgi:hypothetical protein